jgi:tripeptide aminopeptidase
MKAKAHVLVLMLALGGSVAHAQTPDQRATALLSSQAFNAAGVFFDRDYDRFVSELIAITEIPAPPFKEQQRAAAYERMLREAGLADVETDTEGNVMGVRRGRSGGSMLAVIAHLDTVFPEGTDVRVKREGTRLLAPGVGDDSRGLALLLSMVRAMDAARIQTDADILFVGSVGEEGEGDLRGVRHLFRTGKYAKRIQQSIALDGSDQSRITNGALGSKRFRVTFKGPGGHSYSAFGTVSPAFAMGNAMARISRIKVPSSPKTTFNVGVVSGGTSVNSIPNEMAMDVDLRSESASELDKVVAALRALVQDAVDEENRARSTSTGHVVVEFRLIGDRPGGETPVGSPLVSGASAVLRAFGLTPAFAIASTDSNVPIGMGIPAITIGVGGLGGRAHALDEWTDVEKASVVRAGQVALAIVLSAAGVR